MKTLNDIIKELNDTYNLQILSVKKAITPIENINIDDDATQQKNTKIQKINKITKNASDNLAEASITTNMSDMFECYMMYDKNVQKSLKAFSEINRKISEMMTHIGGYSISDILTHHLNKTQTILKIKVNGFKDYYDTVDNIFVPVNINISKRNNLENRGYSDKRNNLENQGHSDKRNKANKDENSFKISKISMIEKYDILLDNVYKIVICIDDNKYEIYGFFEYDCVNSNVRTSQITNNYLYMRRKTLVDIMDPLSKHKCSGKLGMMSNEFKNNYMKHLSIGDVLTFDETNFVNHVIDDYKIYQRYTTINNFKNLFNEFSQVGLLTKFKIIKFLLMRSNINDAGLLFGMTKETKIGYSIISDIIYKNLGLSLQSKLFKTNTTVKSELEKINEIDTDDIDLKKQILSSKNMPHKAKKLALEKINEMRTGNSEYYKQMLFVKTLIDFPWPNDNDGDIFMGDLDVEKWEHSMTSVEGKLDEKVYGHRECKNTIVELLGKWFSNPKSLGKAIGLCGPPGVGKTLIAKELGDALGIPCTTSSFTDTHNTSGKPW